MHKFSRKGQGLAEYGMILVLMSLMAICLCTWINEKASKRVDVSTAIDEAQKRPTEPAPTDHGTQ